MNHSHASLPRLLFVTGSDTGVGKTYFSSLLVQQLGRAGFTVGACKPVETGCVLRGGRPRAADGRVLFERANAGQSEDEVCPWRFLEPVAPNVAARLEGVSLERELVLRHIFAQAQRAPMLLVEGAGGICVPFGDTWTFADLIVDAAAKGADVGVVVVIGSKLGAINHATLTFEALRARGIPVAGYVLNDCARPAEENAGHRTALETNRVEIRRAAARYGISELAYLPWGEHGDDVSLAYEIMSFFEREELHAIEA
ncbi:MAG: dethiobiotin synthase [Bdellovibrionales bacterium]|nr:dethiobiotin synthase [Bdellovibrionales bacterium]